MTESGAPRKPETPLRLTFAAGLYDRLLPIYSGEVTAPDLDIAFVVEESPRTLFDQMASGAFDAAEMSLSEYVVGIASGNSDLVGLPVFPGRMFRHGFIVVNSRSGIREPKDLAGKRIGMPLYSQSANLYIRGMLTEHYGVDFSDVTWIEGGMTKSGGHGNAVSTLLDPNIRLQSNTSGRSLNDLLEGGDIDATIGSQLPPALGRNPDIRRLFEDFAGEEQHYYRDTGIFPIMHLVAVRRALAEAHPWALSQLYTVLCTAQDIAWARLNSLSGGLPVMLPWLRAHVVETRAVLGDNPWPYGVAENRTTLAAFLRYARAQGIIGHNLSVDALFADFLAVTDR